MADDRALIASARSEIERCRANGFVTVSLSLAAADALLRHYDALRLNESKRASFEQSYGARR